MKNEDLKKYINKYVAIPYSGDIWFFKLIAIPTEHNITLKVEKNTMFYINKEGSIVDRIDATEWGSASIASSIRLATKEELKQYYNISLSVNEKNI